MSCPDCVYSIERVRRGDFERFCMIVPSIPVTSTVTGCTRFKRKRVEGESISFQPKFGVSRENTSISSEFPRKKRGRPKGGKRDAL